MPFDSKAKDGVATPNVMVAAIPAAATRLDIMLVLLVRLFSFVISKHHWPLAHHRSLKLVRCPFLVRCDTSGSASDGHDVGDIAGHSQ
jgi:hypothetical protein